MKTPLLYILSLLTTLSFTHAQNVTEGDCRSGPSCIEAYDTAAVCGVRVRPENIDDLSHVSYVNDEQRRCLCQTRGFVRTAVDCLYCWGGDTEEWEAGCEDVPKKGLTAGAIAGIVVGCVCVAGIVAFAIYKRASDRKSAVAGAGAVEEARGGGGGGGGGMEKMEQGFTAGGVPGELREGGSYDQPVGRRELDGHQRVELPGGS